MIFFRQNPRRSEWILDISVICIWSLTHHLHVINDTSCNKYPTGLTAVSNKHQLNYRKMAARAEDEEQNIRVFLRNRPGESNPVSVENFGTETVAIPECKQGEIVAKTLCLSVDPYMRVRFNANWTNT